jgi:hypothetical protein
MPPLRLAADNDRSRALAGARRQNLRDHPPTHRARREPDNRSDDQSEKQKERPNHHPHRLDAPQVVLRKFPEKSASALILKEQHAVKAEDKSPVDRQAALGAPQTQTAPPKRGRSIVGAETRSHPPQRLGAFSIAA